MDALAIVLHKAIDDTQTCGYCQIYCFEWQLTGSCYETQFSSDLHILDLRWRSCVHYDDDP